MQEIKVYVVGTAKYYADFMKNIKLTDKIEEADIVLFTGGEDVTPSFYGCKKHPRTYSNIHRDLEEKIVFEKIRKDQFVVGICRGLIVAHVKWGELSGTLKRKPAAKSILKNIGRFND